MGKEIISSNEIQFIINSLKESQRLDGRDLLDIRNLQIEFSENINPCYSEVKLGKSM